MIIQILVMLTAVVYTFQEEKTVTESATTATWTATTQTSFSCEGRVTGYYADVGTGCRTYHYCIGSQQYTYECPNNTLFQQRIFICNHWYLVDCGTSEQFYNANLLIGQRDKPFVGEDDASVPPTYPVAYATTQPSDAKVTETATLYEEYTKSSFSHSDAEDIQRVETTTAASRSTARTTERSRDGKAKQDVEQDERFIRLKFADPRGLFYIPEGNNSVQTLSAAFREFLIPRIANEEVMHFKLHPTETRFLPCSKFCDLRYVRPGTCHPCITVK